MKVFTNDYRIEHYDSPLWGEYFNSLKPCVLDIEATGLDPKRCKLVLMGLLTETDSGIRVTQFLAENHYEEYKVLQATIDFLKDEGIDYIITFNGLRYDIPFIQTRLQADYLNDSIKIYDFDLYRFLRKFSTLPDRLDSLSQASLERFWNIASDREDTINGRESVALFDEYALNGNPVIEKLILTHNREDVIQLYKLLKLSGESDFKEILKTDDFHSAIATYGFPVNNARYSVRTCLNPNKSTLKITGDQITDPVSAAFFPDIDDPITAIFNASTSSLEIEVPLESHNNEFYADIKKLGIDIGSDSELIGNYLILNSRTINLLAEKAVIKYDELIR